ncbi:unnamed protein product, partial [Mesorhabditis belari]|uniref:Uncharacterized protein n=1 Tax=Mesorhabditis belari TaxID=2138241 RepID=A0AAF3EP67_9BILA
MRIVVFSFLTIFILCDAKFDWVYCEHDKEIPLIRMMSREFFNNSSISTRPSNPEIVNCGPKRRLGSCADYRLHQNRTLKPKRYGTVVYVGEQRSFDRIRCPNTTRNHGFVRLVHFVHKTNQSFDSNLAVLSNTWSDMQIPFTLKPESLHRVLRVLHILGAPSSKQEMSNDDPDEKIDPRKGNTEKSETQDGIVITAYLSTVFCVLLGLLAIGGTAFCIGRHMHASKKACLRDAHRIVPRTNDNNDNKHSLITPRYQPFY